MPRIIFSGHKKCIAEFDAEDVQFEPQEGALLLTAGGTMVAQDTAMVEELLQGNASCNVTITKDGRKVLDQVFRITIFAFEANNLAVLLE